jgi:hypothetical protein
LRYLQLLTASLSIQEHSEASTGDASVFDKPKLIRLWRSIILSSFGETGYPYCLWIKALPLGSLEILLDDIARDSVGKNALFAPPLQDFYIEKTIAKATREKAKYSPLDSGKITSMVADKITSYVKESADREDRTAALSSLEGHQPPANALPTWLSRLSLLSSLTLREGGVLGPETAKAIREHCPLFKELRCHWCMGADVDKNLAGFLEILPADTMEIFEIISLNQIGKQTFKALGHHAHSLKSLWLSSIRDSEWQHLGALSDCTALESLILEGSNSLANFNWEAEHNQSFLDVAAWLKECRQLKSLDMILVPSVTALLGQVLKSPSVHLQSLRLQLHIAATDDSLWTSIGSQTPLRNLSIRCDKDEESLSITAPQQVQFVNSICECHHVDALHVPTMLLSFEDLVRIRESLPQLADFTFDSDLLTDAALVALAQMDRLKTVTINGYSMFTFDGIMDFIGDVASNASSHHELQLTIANQGNKFSEQEEQMLQREMADRIKGARLEFVYWRDPDELHDDDELFSD